jgi:carbon-monoxide dehydrogenase small subunit
MKIALTLNGEARSVEAPPMMRLLDLVREQLGLTGTKEGCGEGECGACTVLVDGRAVNSCLVPSCQVDGAEVVTVEGGAAWPRLARMQRAFLEHGAAQCGICTPGMIVAACALPDGASREQIRIGLAGNLCRCTGYVKIYDAVERALAKPSSSTKVAAKRAKATPRKTKSTPRKTKATSKKTKATSKKTKATSKKTKATSKKTKATSKKTKPTSSKGRSTSRRKRR